ncbi:nucleotide exchange factor GrpE [Caldicellulosiruptoraceae bacterium PP1]
MDDNVKTNQNEINEEINENIQNENVTESINNDEKIEVENKENIEQNEENQELNEIIKKLEQKEKEIEEYKNLCQRVAADFDNYKKRMAKDRENMYFEVVADVVSKILPIVDNFERAINSAKETDNKDEMLKGLEMIKKQIDDVLSKLGIEPIEALNKEFDPYLHNAIMHVEDENYGKNIVIEELQKGYKLKDRVIRYSLVKVANAN